MTPFSDWTPLLDGPPQFTLLSLFFIMIAYHHIFYNQLLNSDYERAPQIRGLLDARSLSN